MVGVGVGVEVEVLEVGVGEVGIEGMSFVGGEAVV